MVPNFDVKGKVFVITGAAGILCSELARELGALGAPRKWQRRSAIRAVTPWG